MPITTLRPRHHAGARSPRIATDGLAGATAVGVPDALAMLMAGVDTGVVRGGAFIAEVGRQGATLYCVNTTWAEGDQLAQAVSPQVSSSSR